MKLFEPHTGASRSDGADRRTPRSAYVGFGVTAGLLAVALAAGLYLYTSARAQIASINSAAPVHTTGSTTSTPNERGITPPASR